MFVVVVVVVYPFFVTKERKMAKIVVSKRKKKKNRSPATIFYARTKKNIYLATKSSLSLSLVKRLPPETTLPR